MHYANVACTCNYMHQMSSAACTRKLISCSRLLQTLPRKNKVHSIASPDHAARFADTSHHVIPSSIAQPLILCPITRLSSGWYHWRYTTSAGSKDLAESRLLVRSRNIFHSACCEANRCLRRCHERSPTRLNRPSIARSLSHRGPCECSCAC